MLTNLRCALLARAPSAAAIGGAAKIWPDLEDFARAGGGEVIDQRQHVEVQHRMFVTDNLQLVADGLLTILDQCLHEADAV